MPRGLFVVVVLWAAVSACGNQPPPQAQAPVPPAAAAPAPASSSTSSPSSPSYLPLPDVPFAPARPMPIVEAVFHFAADHPEVLSRIPCFCGCENRGHKHNDDCFVAARDERGRVTAWEPHGIG
jgi:hypothetical protein